MITAKKMHWYKIKFKYLILIYVKVKEKNCRNKSLYDRLSFQSIISVYLFFNTNDRNGK